MELQFACIFYHAKHNPCHIHAYYSGYNATISIIDGEIIDGKLPRNAYKLVLEWISLHKHELLKMWDSQEFKRIAPLDEEVK